MKGSFSTINVSSARLKLIFGRKWTSRFLSFGNLGSSASYLLEDEHPYFEDSNTADDGLLPSAKCDPAEFKELNELPYGGSDSYEFVDRGSSISENQRAEGDKMKTIKCVPSNYRLNLAAQNACSVDLNPLEIIHILKDLFEEKLDAALALCFFRLSHCCAGVEHTVRSLCRMMHILVSGNMNYRAVDLVLHLVRNNGGEEGSYDLLVKLLYETHTDQRVLETICSMVVDCYIKENEVGVAIKITRQMKHLNIFPSMGVFNSLLSALLGSHQLDLAWDLLEDLQGQGMGINTSIISVFINRYCTEGKLEYGWRLLMEMQNYGIKPDIVAYTSVINSLCKMSCLKEATSILFKLIKSGITLDSVLVSSVIDGYCKVGKSEEAIIISKLFNIAPNVYMYNSFMSKLCADGKMVEASIIFYEMSELGLLPDCLNYTTMIGGYCKARDINKAFQYLGKMLKSGIKPSLVTYTLLISTYCKFADMGMAECLLQKMITEGLAPDIVTYNTLMDGYGKKGYLHKTFELLDMMRSAGISPDVVTYNTLIHSLVVRGFVNEAKGIFDELVRRGFSPDVVTFTAVIDGFSKRGNFEQAFFVWFYMSEHRVKPDVLTCSALLNGYCRARRMDEAYALFLKMLDVGLIPDLVLYNTLIHGFCNVGNMNDACNLVRIMVKHGILPNNITHRALVLGFEKKWVKNPVESAALKVQQILLRYGIHIDVDEYIAMIQQPTEKRFFWG